MMKRIPCWFWWSLIHPALSLLAFCAVWLIFTYTSPADQAWLRAAYAILKYVFLLNTPGHWLLERAYEAQSGTMWTVYAICCAMVLLTWAFFVLPVCWCVRDWWRLLRR